MEEREEERGVEESRHGQVKGSPRTALRPFLRHWKDVETFYGTLSSFTPNLTYQGFFLAQVQDFTMVNGKPTGDLVIPDMVKWVRVKIEKRYVFSLMGREWGKYSIVQIKATTHTSPGKCGPERHSTPNFTLANFLSN